MGRWLQKDLPKSCIIYPVGAFFERPRANTVRPYRVLGISPLKLHALQEALFDIENEKNIKHSKISA